MNGRRTGSAWFDELVGVIGAAATRRLCDAYGGARLYVPARMSPNDPIAREIGLTAAQKLSHYSGGQTIDLPKSHVRKRRARQLLAEGDMSMRDIALATDYTERRLYQLQAERREAEASGQGDLFGHSDGGGDGGLA